MRSTRLDAVHPAARGAFVLVKGERDAVDAAEGGRHLKTQTALTPDGGLAGGADKRLSADMQTAA